MKKVCIIGSGPAGLSALKHALENPNFEPVVFERAGSIGGVWRYCEKKGTPETTERFPTPMYGNLRMNTPKLMGQFSDFPWPKDTDTFPTRQDAIEYIQNYANTFNLMSRIMFNQQVILIKPIDQTNRENPRWNISVKDLETGKPATHEFDAVVICTGREMEPYIPVVANIDEFKGSITFAGKYTGPGVYNEKRVLLLGSGPSTIDISLDLLPIAKEVIVSSNPLPKVFNIDQKFPPTVRKVGPWKSATSDGFILQDDTKLEGIDVVIFGTGYDFNHSFLAPECGISLENGKRVNFLYRHMVNVKFTTMCFSGVAFYGAGFSLFSVLSKWIMKVLDGTIKLPNEYDMMVEITKRREEILSLGLNEFGYAHNIAIQQWSLFDNLSKEGGFTLNPYAKQVYEHLLPRIFNAPEIFRRDMYKIIDENTVHVEVAT